MKKLNRVLQMGVTLAGAVWLLQAPTCVPNFGQQVLAQISGRGAAIIGNIFELALIQLFG